MFLISFCSAVSVYCLLGALDVIFFTYVTHTTTGTGSPPQKKKFNCENLKFGLKCSVWALITSELVRIFSPNFSRPHDELWSTYWPTRSASYTVIWHKSIHHVFLFGVIRTTSRHTGVLSCVVLINSVLSWVVRVNSAASLFAALAAAPAIRRCAVLGAFRTHSPAVITARGILTK